MKFREYNMTRTKSVILGLLTLVLLVSCGGTRIENKICELPPNVTNSFSRSDNLAISVYLDGTPSMQGYVNPGNTRYKQTLKLLDDTFSLSSGELQYNRLGTNIQKIQRPQFITDAPEPKFYSGNNQYPPQSVSQIDKAIKPGNDSQMSVIVTDLYQKDSDVTQVNRVIRDNYLNSGLLNKGYAVGVIAIKSEFQGTVYTEVSSSSKFSYNTQGKKPDQYHPFYVIFLGKYSDIDYYFDKLNQEGETLIKDSQLVIFSPQSTLKKTLHFPTKNSPQATLIKDKSNKTYQNYRRYSLKNRRVRIEGEGYPLELLQVGIRDTDKISINYQLSASYSKYSLPLKTTSIETKITTKDAITYLLDSQDNTDNNTDTNNKIQLSKFKLDEERQKFKFTTTIQPENIELNKINVITADVIATELQEPDWWKEWSSNESNITDGSKTYNLTRFLRGLKRITTDLMTQNNSQSSIGRFCYVIQKK